MTSEHLTAVAGKRRHGGRSDGRARIALKSVHAGGGAVGVEDWISADLGVTTTAGNDDGEAVSDFARLNVAAAVGLVAEGLGQVGAGNPSRRASVVVDSAGGQQQHSPKCAHSPDYATCGDSWELHGSAGVR